MPHEVIGEIIGLGIEAGAEIASENKKGGCGCIIGIVIIILSCVALYYFS